MCAMEANNKRVTRPLKLSNEMLRFAYSSHSKTELPNKGIAQYEIQCPFQQQHCNHFYAFFRPSSRAGQLVGWTLYILR